jgi:hypothetical protein
MSRVGTHSQLIKVFWILMFIQSESQISAQHHYRDIDESKQQRFPVFPEI